MADIVYTKTEPTTSKVSVTEAINRVYDRTNERLNVAAGAGTAIIGQVGIDQTTPGTTNKMAVGNPLTVYNATGATAIALSTTMAKAFRLLAVTIHLSAAPTTSQNLTITLNANDGAAYDTVLYKVDLAGLAATDIAWTPSGDEGVLESGDEIDVAWANTDTRTYGIRIVCEAI